MPLHLFSGAHAIDYSTAIRANIAAQHFSVCPRHWYINARFLCSECGADFLWSAKEQRSWFETYKFWIDSRPKLCPSCSAKRRNLLHLRQEHDSLVAAARAGGTRDQKLRVIEIIDALESHFARIPEKLAETRALFQKQIAGNNSQ